MSCHTLISGNISIGDFFSNLLPLAQALKDQRGERVSLLLWRKPQLKKIASCIPLFESVVSFDDAFMGVDWLKSFGQFDRIIPDVIHPPTIPPLWANSIGLEVVSGDWSKWLKWMQRTDGLLRVFGLKFKPEYLSISLSWFQSYYKDFGCHSNSLLLHCDSDAFIRSYIRGQDLKKCFESKGYDVRTLNLSADIRENLFLIAQVPFVLTVDTSVFWMAKALGKKPLCFQEFENATRLGIPFSDCFQSKCLNLETPEHIFSWADARVGARSSFLTCV